MSEIFHGLVRIVVGLLLIWLGYAIITWSYSLVQKNDTIWTELNFVSKSLFGGFIIILGIVIIISEFSRWYNNIRN